MTKATNYPVESRTREWRICYCLMSQMLGLSMACCLRNRLVETTDKEG